MNNFFRGSIPSQCFPGKTGWDFLPEGFSGDRYSRIAEIKTRYQTHGTNPLPLRKSIREALQDLQEKMASDGIESLAVQLPDGSWKVLA